MWGKQMPLVRGTYPRQPDHKCSEMENIHGHENGYENDATFNVRFYVMGGWTLNIYQENRNGWFDSRRKNETHLMIDFCPFCGLHLYRDGYADH